MEKQANELQRCRSPPFPFGFENLKKPNGGRKMKNYRESDYALNKYSDGIVYRMADGSRITVTLENYLSENPDKTAEDFRILKAASDTIYAEQIQQEHIQNKLNVPLTVISDSIKNHEISAEDSLFASITEIEENDNYLFQAEAADNALDILTDIQRRRYIQYHIHGKTLREIADMEGTHNTSVCESLKAAENKIKKFLKKGKKHPCKTPQNDI